MNRKTLVFALFACIPVWLMADPALTIYNQNFAVVRDTVPLDLKEGVNDERRRTNFKVDNGQHWADESFEIKLRNHKKEPVEIRVVEHLYRWNNWTISQNTDPFAKTNAQEIEFRVPLKPDEEKRVSYTVHYTW